MSTARSKFTTLKQICDLIPPHLIPKFAREHGVEEKCRTFNPTSHVVSLMFAQVSPKTLPTSTIAVLSSASAEMSRI